MNGDSDYSKYDLARLQEELEQEREMKEMLDESVSDLRSTMCELQERLHSVDGEGNEWKTRYETQTELNGQLDRQMSLIHERLEDLRGNPMDRLASIRIYDDMLVETLRQRLKLLTEEKSDLQSQLMDCRSKIEQEGKAFHKTNDERRAYLSEIAKLSSTLEAQRKQYSAQPQRASKSKQRRERQTSRKAEADSKKEKERDEDGGGACLKVGGGGGGATAERREEKKSQRASWLPSLKDYLKHNP
ncbi:coiled-coil domain containing 169 isoform X2 [Sander lucioperca]|uniref:coiled-coil domain containing 169 isoform X2 n=1 Tax=Sander lucioperca TaxID=283035 RepID=UPI00125D756E|nr:coiled-coil domain containing 169 isoform X2 [Sander lucioperca]XP_035847015.1 coiled-coil domain containing 169 isoform X2 [Sander lucioperca]